MAEIKFGTDGWRAIIAEDFTTANVARVAAAAASWILGKKDKAPSVVIGHDCRFGGDMFAGLTARVMAMNGIKAYLAEGFVSTPMISLGTVKLGASAGVIITASHNPPSYNGFKIKDAYGGPALEGSIAEVESLIREEPVFPVKSLDDLMKSGMVESVNLEQMYLDHVEAHFDLELIRSAGIGIAYDAMYGSGQNVMRRLLPQASLLRCEYNPSFMGQAPEPIDRNLSALQTLLKSESNLVFGLATDGDADRLGLYDEDGTFVDSHRIILLLIHYLHKHKGLVGKVVVTFSTSDKIRRLCEAYHLPYLVTKVGFKYICGHMVKDDILVGGEESGGIAVKGHIPERDGIWDGLELLEFMAATGKSLKELLDEIYLIVGNFSCDRRDLHVTEKVKQAVLEKCGNGGFPTFGAYQVRATETTDGFKFRLDDDRWLMIRASGTEPLIRVYAEAATEEELKKILDSATETILMEKP